MFFLSLCFLCFLSLCGELSITSCDRSLLYCLFNLCLLSFLLFFLFTVIFHVVYQDQVLRISDVVRLRILIFMRMSRSTDQFGPRTQDRRGKPSGARRVMMRGGGGRRATGDGNTDYIDT